MSKLLVRPMRVTLLLVLVLAVSCIYGVTTASSAPLNSRSATLAGHVQSASHPLNLSGLASVPRNETLVVAPWYLSSTLSNPTTFNIYAPGDLSMHGIGNKTVYEGLAYYDPTTEQTIPWLATSWKYTNNYKTLTVYLRKGVTWSDGVPFTANDVQFTYNMLKNNAPTLQYSSAIKATLASVTVTNPLTVVFNLTASNARWANTYMAVGFENHIVPLPEHIWKGQNPVTFTNENIAKGWPVGTGPYKLVSAGPYQQVWDENPSYWGSATGFTNLPAPKRIIMIPGASDQALSQLYLSNTIDTGYALQPATYKAVAPRNPYLTTWNAKGPNFGAADGCFDDLDFNNAVAPFNNVNVRLAINYSLNRQQIDNLAYGGIDPPAVVPFSSFVSAKYVQGTGLGKVIAAANLNRQNFALVAQYMKAAGYQKDSSGQWALNGKVLVVPITGPAGLSPEVPVIQAQLQAGGFDAVEDIRADNSTWATQFVDGDLGMVNFVFCQSLTEPYDTLQDFSSSIDGANVAIGSPCPNELVCSRFSNKTMDTLINEMEAVPDPSPTNAKYMSLAAQATSIYLKNMPIIMLVAENWIVPTSTKYWTGWPTAANPYEAPFPSWEGWMVILHQLKPAKP